MPSDYGQNVTVPAASEQICSEAPSIVTHAETLHELENLHGILNEMSTQDSQGRSDSGVVQHDAFLVQARLCPRYAPKQGAPKLQSAIC